MVVFAIHWHESATGVHVSPCPESHSHFFPHPIPLGCPSASALNTLLHALNLDWSSISHMVIYMFQCNSLKSCHLHTVSFNSCFRIWIPFISFPSLIAAAKTSKTMLNSSGEIDTLFCSWVYGKYFQFFAIEDNVCCGFLICGFYYVE